MKVRNEFTKGNHFGSKNEVLISIVLLQALTLCSQEALRMNPEHFDHRSADPQSPSLLLHQSVSHSESSSISGLLILLPSSQAVLPFQGFSIFLYGLLTMKN
jgi:hypothetical protein